MPDRDSVEEKAKLAILKHCSHGLDLVVGGVPMDHSKYTEANLQKLADEINAAVSRIVEEERNKAIDQTRIECHKNFEGVSEALAKDAAVKALEKVLILLGPYYQFSKDNKCEEIFALADRVRKGEEKI